MRRRKEILSDEEKRKNKSNNHPQDSDSCDKNGLKSTKDRWHFPWGFLKYIALLLVAPAFLNHASLYRESQGLQPKGELYDIGWGQKMFMGCVGRGAPTVILDAPSGTSSDAWSLVISELSKFTKVCYYDRGGLGFSDRPFVNTTSTDSKEVKLSRAKPFTTERMVEDFHRLFTASSDQKRPFILVGADLGAVNVKFYSQMFEQNVFSLILVNPLDEGMFVESRNQWIQMWHNKLVSFQTLQFLAAVGLSRLALIIGVMKLPQPWQSISKETEVRQKHLLCKPGHLSSVVDELFFANESLSQFRTVLRVKPFPKKDVSVISSETYDGNLAPEVNKIWSDTQDHIMRVVHPSCEKLHLSGPATTALVEHSSTIVGVIRKHVQKWRHRTRTATH